MPDIAEIRSIILKLRSLHVDTPRHGTFLRHFNRLLNTDEDGQLCHVPMRFTEGNETRGLMVVDGAGGGKTTMIKRALEKHPAMQAAPGEQPHYIVARVPTPATFKSMGTTLLQSSGYNTLSKRDEAWRIWEKLRMRLHAQDVSVLWIDEAHDFFCADRDLILRALKALMQGDEALIVILSGTERLSEIVRSDPQLQRRLSIQNLPPVSVATDEGNFLNIINHYCQFAGLAAPLEDELVPRLFHASRYRFGRSIENVINAIEVAIEEGAGRLDIQHFITAYSMTEGCTPGANIFSARQWMTIDPDRADQTEPEPKKRRRAA